MIKIFLNFLATVGIVGQYFLKYIIENKKTQQKAGIYLLILASLSIWGSFYIQWNESNEQAKNFQYIKSTNTELKTILSEREKGIKYISEQNDSLKILLHDLRKQQNEIKIITELAAYTISRNNVRFDQINYESLTRGISPIDKINMINILKEFKGKGIRLVTILGNSEAFQFAHQIREIFEQAGWNVDGVDQAVFTEPIKGIIVKIKDKNIPKYIDSIIKAFNLLRITPTGFTNPDHNLDVVEVIIGAK